MPFCILNLEFLQKMYEVEISFMNYNNNNTSMMKFCFYAASEFSDS